MTYDVLDAPSKPSGVFVGREDLLRPLEAAVGEVSKRGTILVSGYRGSGKTTLVIEALRRAALSFEQRTEKERPRLLPVVLNVSEVSTSLAASSDAKLQIDPRRLLIALLRAFRQRHTRLDDDKELVKRVEQLYEKATAAEFKLARSAEQSAKTVREQEAGVKIDAPELLKAALVPAGLLTLSMVSLGGHAGDLNKAISAAAAVGGFGALTVGGWLSSKRTNTQAKEIKESLAAVHDNSLQQLENDLKDLLHELHRKRWRTVIVLEELDKLGDDGKELDEVVRYFKNLFTQAPALFIFVTDKSYYDRIAREIRSERRKGSYAVAHTFFTHRFFVGRSTLRECLDFVAELLPDSEHQGAVRGIYTSTRWATESYAARTGELGAESNTLSLLVRVCLFRASNHLFDLKAELQRYVTPEPGGTFLRFDSEIFPAEDRPLAKFQDLLADKARIFAIKGGRAYANEALGTCLAATFNDIGSQRAFSADSLYPIDREGADDDGLLGPFERGRIVEAINSLLDDLVRGGALTRKTQGNATELLWAVKAAEAFSLQRRLEAHEEQLVAELQRRLADVQFLATLHADPELEAECRQFAKSLDGRITRVSDLETKVSVDQAESERQAVQSGYQNLAARVRARVSGAAMERHGLQFESTPIGSYAPGDGARLLVTRDGDPRSNSNAQLGVVILIEGINPIRATDVVRFIDTLKPVRAGIVHFMPECNEEERSAFEATWYEAFRIPEVIQRRTTSRRRVAGRPRELSEAFPTAQQIENDLAREILSAAVWALRPTGREGRERGPIDVSRAVEGWLDVRGGPPILFATDLRLDAIVPAVAFEVWRAHPTLPWLLPFEMGSLASSAVELRGKALTWIDQLLPQGADAADRSNERASRVLDFLSQERGALVANFDRSLSSEAIMQTVGTGDSTVAFRPWLIARDRDQGDDGAAPEKLIRVSDREARLFWGVWADAPPLSDDRPVAEPTSAAAGHSA